MTTIVCDRKRMIGDRRISDSNGYFFQSTKIFKIKGDAVGAAGPAADCEDFMEWYGKRDRVERPTHLDKEEFEAVVLTKSGIYCYDHACVAIKVERDFHAIGSGALGALVAVEKGASLEDAIALVTKFSTETGPEIDVIEL